MRLPAAEIHRLLRSLAYYARRSLPGDITAGLTVGIMLVPQGMAYAFLAGLPPIYGLYASLVPLLVYAIAGSSRHLAVGTTAVDSLIMGFALSALAQAGSERYIELALLYAFMVGTIHLALAAGRMGFLINLLSRPVILGFISAAATMIGFSQLSSILGLELERSQYIYDIVYSAARQIGDTHVLSLLIGLCGAFLLLILDRWRRIPAALLLVVLGIVVTGLFRLDLQGVAIVGAIPVGLPAFAAPVFDWGAIQTLAPTALMLALIQFSNVGSLAKSFAARHDYTIKPNRELLALGMANVAGSFFQSFPISGSVSRTAVNERAGAQTRAANAFAALLVGLTLLVLTPLLYYLPIPILAALIMVAAFGLIDVRELVQLYRMKRTDGHLAMMTFLMTLGFGLEAGILVGIAASVVAIMYRISRPNFAILGHLPGTRSFRDLNLYPEAREVEGVLVLRVDASFSYANADFLKDLILEKCDPVSNRVRGVVIDASSVNDLDTTAVTALFSIVDNLAKHHIALYFAGIHGSVEGVLRRSGLADRLGADRIFLSPYRAVRHIQGLPEIELGPKEAASLVYED
ncbi:MAG: sulfate permease [Rhodothermales bacterium]|nr:sulfate permease [Rhodothermales bacterium]